MKRILPIALAFSPLAAHAYDWIGAKWNIAAGGSVPYVVSNRLTTDVPDPDALAAVQQGYDVWTALPCSYMAWRYEGRTENTAWGAPDGQNVASWREENWDDSPAALGIAATSWGGGGGLSDADIKFNGFHHSWAAFPPGGPPAPRAGAPTTSSRSGPRPVTSALVRLVPRNSATRSFPRLAPPHPPPSRRTT